jgi:hypothetical protein
MRAALLFAVILLGALDPRPLLHIPQYANSDGKVPLYPLFLQEVAARTAPGQSIAIAAPMRQWNAGYAYAYYRASYFLAGRRVIPLIDPDDSLHLERLRDAELLAMWRLGPPQGPYEVIWSGHGGTLYRRTR